jgi:hypothetical protein
MRKTISSWEKTQFYKKKKFPVFRVRYMKKLLFIRKLLLYEKNSSLWELLLIMRNNSRFMRKNFKFMRKNELFMGKK